MPTTLPLTLTQAKLIAMPTTLPLTLTQAKLIAMPIGLKAFSDLDGELLLLQLLKAESAQVRSEE